MTDALDLREVDVSVLRLQPGDLLALHFPAETTNVEAALDSVRQAVDDAGWPDVPVVAFWNGVRLEVVRPE